MAPHHRHRLAASRRFEDEGEDEGSVAGEYEDDSLSDASSHDDHDGEESDFSDHDTENAPRSGKEDRSDAQIREAKQTSAKKSTFDKRTTETEIMLNGLKLAGDAADVEEINFQDMTANRNANSGVNKGRSLSRAQRRKRTQDTNGKERARHTASAPALGNLVYNDRRSGNSSPGYLSANHKPKSKPLGLLDSTLRRALPKPDVTDGPWTHDLHESIIQEPPPAPSRPSSTLPSTIPSAQSPKLDNTAPQSTDPSYTNAMLLGNVPVMVYLPGMGSPVHYTSVPKKLHICLPQHRPPLRRDKPVRIALPGSSPRYIFPEPKRSFIFIPRALRPNQQASRGRGRGGFYGSRRNSLYGGTAYTSSLPMSRRSSIGMVATQDGMASPGGSVVSRPGIVSGEIGKPIVRLPPAPRGPPPTGPVGPPPVIPATAAGMPPVPQPPPYAPQHPPYRESRSTPTIPMHQPRPQKTVSVADIESPMTFYNPPPQQQEQPFHQQVPVAVGGPSYGPEGPGYAPHSRHPSHPSQVSGTPLPQIPERAIHAAPFQPYPYQPPQNYYPPGPYPPGPVMYPGPSQEYPPYGAPVPGPPAVYVPPGQQGPFVVPPPPPPPPPSNEQGGPSGTVAHESNGTVYYYDASQFPNYPNNGYPPPGPQGGVVGMGGMMTPPGTYYYPQQPNGTVYYS